MGDTRGRTWREHHDLTGHTVTVRVGEVEQCLDCPWTAPLAELGYDPLLIAALASGVPLWMAAEAVATTRLSHADDEDTQPWNCRHCQDTGHVCEDHSDKPWAGITGPVDGHPEHGGAGMPCLTCCRPIPQDGTVQIGDAFESAYDSDPIPRVGREAGFRVDCWFQLVSAGLVGATTARVAPRVAGLRWGRGRCGRDGQAAVGRARTRARSSASSPRCAGGGRRMIPPA